MPGRGELVTVAAVCVTAIHGWSVVAAFEKVPSWAKFLNLWEMASIFAYAQLFALVESALLMSIMILLAVLLPRLFRREFVAQSALLVASVIAWGVYVHSVHESARSALQLLLLIAGIVIVVSRLLLRVWPGFRRAIVGFTERFTVFLYLYLPVVVASGLIVLLRNLR